MNKAFANTAGHWQVWYLVSEQSWRNKEAWIYEDAQYLHAVLTGTEERCSDNDFAPKIVSISIAMEWDLALTWPFERN